jgi:GH25 family lysozyme M1 (1,4-beta-N-acetylmuramidase)
MNDKMFFYWKNNVYFIKKIDVIGYQNSVDFSFLKKVSGINKRLCHER